ncbi:MAG: 50S ribosomal protein L4 [candidate division TM6 bacterium GW2011_GWF2_38_10]|nr:MAG: 50S ribosomal protein L4 [candidate division TM6 bacterium GW2011_GWF2_38_10]
MSQIQMFNAQGQLQGNIALDLDLTRKTENQVAFARAIRALLQNWRQGTVGCKSRGQVAFANRKPWKQKGTGRARVSSLRSPLWRKGGVTFGPQARVRKLSVNDKERTQVLNNIFFSLFDKNAIHCLDFGADIQTPKTKTAYQMIKGMDLTKQKVVLFLHFDDMANFATFRNIPNINILSFDQPNAYDLSNGDCWVFLKKDLELFKEMILQWN